MGSPSLASAVRTVIFLLMVACCGVVPAAGSLPELNIDIKQTTVSGISSGAFMAVQVGVAKSDSVRGVAAIAGGPYFCALQDSKGGVAVSRSIARCMQGDPMYPAQAITASQLDEMESTARDWAAKGKISPVGNMSHQAVWIFHGYNDGIVKLPVSAALVDWYARFVPTNQIFYKDTLNAAHAQISAACPSGSGSNSCNTCSITGGNFINSCSDQPAVAGELYDAAGAALQMFYGPLKRTPSAQLTSRPQAFSQMPFLKLRDGTGVNSTKEIAMNDTGYVYIPKACKNGAPCRLHIAFHGCLQSASAIKTAFVDEAGANEWADANNIVVLYPQATSTNSPGELKVSLPTNPMGCWDWWGYNDFRDWTSFSPQVGYYATAKGLQIAAVWRMAEKLAAKGSPVPDSSVAGPATTLKAIDQSATKALLRWIPVKGATAYHVYRSSSGESPTELTTTQPFIVDSGLTPLTQYRYTVRAVVSNTKGPDSNPVVVKTAREPPSGCNPYFSLSLNTPVKPDPFIPTGVPTTEVCQ